MLCRGWPAGPAKTNKMRAIVFFLLSSHLAEALSPLFRLRKQQHFQLRATDSEEDGDFITKVFKRFLPKPEDMGLTRLSVETAPEQFPCTKSRWALPLACDDPTMKIFRPALAQTNFESRELRIAFDASIDGWSFEKFHAKLDRQGPAVVFCRTKNGGVFGGYNPKGWVNYGEYRGSLAAFLFVWLDGDTSKRPVKLAKVGGAGLAQWDDGGGPRFGADSLVIPLGFQGGNERAVRCKLGAYYERLPGGSNTFLPGGRQVDELSELLVYVGVYGEDEFVPFTDAEPFALN